jgi:flagellar basal-body rod protein FlgF
MVRGMYAAASSMLTQMHRQDVWANNLANANTAGYKRELATAAPFPAVLAASINSGTDVAQAASLRNPSARLSGGTVVAPGGVDLKQGALVATERPLDLAIDGNGFFVVATPGGERLTRSGAFVIDPTGVIVDASGYALLGTEAATGQSAPIRVDGPDFVVTSDGTVTVQGRTVARLRIEVPENAAALSRIGGTLFDAAGPRTAATGYTIKQGFLERANVNPVKELGQMMIGFRAFEASQRALSAQDQSLQWLIDSAV